MLTQVKPKKKHVSPFFDAEMDQAYKAYAQRYIGSKKRGFVHAALEYYLPWKEEAYGLTPTEGWQKVGDPPQHINSPKESREEKNKGGHYGTVDLDPKYADAIARIEEIEQRKARQIVAYAIKAYLCEMGFLSTSGEAV